MSLDSDHSYTLGLTTPTSGSFHTDVLGFRPQLYFGFDYPYKWVIPHRCPWIQTTVILQVLLPLQVGHSTQMSVGSHHSYTSLLSTPTSEPFYTVVLGIRSQLYLYVRFYCSYNLKVGHSTHGVSPQLHVLLLVVFCLTLYNQVCILHRPSCVIYSVGDSTHIY